MIDQKLHRLDVSGAGGDHQRRFAGSVGCFGFAPAFSKASIIGTFGTRVASWSGVTPYRFAALALAPARKQQLYQFQLIPVRGPMQRRHAVDVRCIDVDALLDESLYRGHVAILRRAHQPKVTAAAYAAAACKMAKAQDAKTRLNDASQVRPSPCFRRTSLSECLRFPECVSIRFESGVCLSPRMWRLPFDFSRRAADRDDRQVVVDVLVAVAHAAAVEEQRMIEQVAVAVRRRPSASPGTRANSVEVVRCRSWPSSRPARGRCCCATPDGGRRRRRSADSSAC